VAAKSRSRAHRQPSLRERSARAAVREGARARATRWARASMRERAAALLDLLRLAGATQPVRAVGPLRYPPLRRVRRG
jgi:hypothetical protein